MVAYKRWLLTRGSRLREVLSIVIWLENVWYFGKVLANERWSLTVQEVVAKGGSTVFFAEKYKFLVIWILTLITFVVVAVFSAQKIEIKLQWGNYSLIFFQIFLAYNLDVNSQDVGGWSALHEAAFAGREDFIKLLLSSGARINIQNSDGATPLFTATQYGRHSCLKLLLKEGADLNILTVDNASPLFIAAQEGLAGCINTLLSAGEYFSFSWNHWLCCFWFRAIQWENEICLVLKSGQDLKNSFT